MVEFWARYVRLKEQDGADRADLLDKIEAKYGSELRRQVEVMLSESEALG